MKSLSIIFSIVIFLAVIMVPSVHAFGLLEELTRMTLRKSGDNVEFTSSYTPYEMPLNLQKKAAAGDFVEFIIPFQNNSPKTEEFIIKVPKYMKGQIEVKENTFLVKSGEEASIHLRTIKPAERNQKKNFQILIQTKNFPETVVNLQYHSVDYSLSNHMHPNSFIGKDQLIRAKQRIQTTDWAIRYWVKLKNEADQALRKNVNIPLKAAGYSSTYIYGEKDDAGWRFHRHNEIIQVLKTLSTVFALSGDEKYAVAAKDILVQYANAYPNYELQQKGGRMYSQSLDEAVSMVDILQSYDLLCTSKSLTDSDRRAIELNLLRPSAETLINHPMNQSNWQAWHDAAIGMTGFILGDAFLINEAIHGKVGFYYLMGNGVLNDGLWWEGSISYHMYTLAPINILAEAASKRGYDLYGDPHLKKMFEAPLLYAYPDFVLPVNNDGGKYGTSLISTISSRGYNEYEAAYSHYGDQLFGYLLNNKYQKITRGGDFALFFGENQIPYTKSHAIKSHNFNGAGHGILRTQQEDITNQIYLLLDYGPHSGAHGHFDKLSIDLFGAGKMLAPDFGTPGYGDPLYRSWYKQTVSHNTVVVDGASQREAAGKIISFIDSEKFKYMYAKADQAYHGITYDRSIWMEDGYVLDWFFVSDDKKKHTYDWFMHGLGSLTLNIPLQKQSNPALALDYNHNGYEYLKSVNSGSSTEGIEVKWDQMGQGFHMYSVGTGSASKIFTAFGPGPSTNPNSYTPVLIQRKNGHSAEFITIYQPYKSKLSNKLAGIKEGNKGVRVDLENESQHYFQNYQPKIKGQLLSAKGETSKGLNLDLEKEISVSTVGTRLEITSDKIKLFKRLVMVFKSAGIKTVLINGIETKPTLYGDCLVIEYK